jgi:hypothetical protein
LTLPAIAQFTWERAGEPAVVASEYQWFGKYMLAVMIPHYMHTGFEPFTVEDAVTVTGLPAGKCGWILNCLAGEGHLARQTRRVAGQTHGVAYYVYAQEAPSVDVMDPEDA